MLHSALQQGLCALTGARVAVRRADPPAVFVAGCAVRPSVLLWEACWGTAAIRDGGPHEACRLLGEEAGRTQFFKAV